MYMLVGVTDRHAMIYACATIKSSLQKQEKSETLGLTTESFVNLIIRVPEGGSPTSGMNQGLREELVTLFLIR